MKNANDRQRVVGFVTEGAIDNLGAFPGVGFDAKVVRNASAPPVMSGDYLMQMLNVPGMAVKHFRTALYG
jgi:hypothetical protein